MIQLSVIIPNYNSGDLLRNTLVSLVNVSSKLNLEVVIVDNLSRDSPFEIIREFKNLKIIFVSEADKGIYDAMNKGVDYSNGKWLYFLGSGDEMISESISEDLFHHSFDYFYGKVYDLQKEIIVGGETTIYDLFRYGFCHQAIFYRRDIFDLFKYDLNYKIQSSLVFNISLFFNKKFKGLFINLIFCNYLGNGISSKNRDIELKKRRFAILFSNLYSNFGSLNLVHVMKYLIYKLVSKFKSLIS